MIASAEENSVKVIGGGARNPATANGLKEKASKSRIFREKLSACAGGASERRHRPLPSTEAGKRRATGTREKGKGSVRGPRESRGVLGIRGSHFTWYSQDGGLETKLCWAVAGCSAEERGMEYGAQHRWDGDASCCVFF